MWFFLHCHRCQRVCSPDPMNSDGSGSRVWLPHCVLGLGSLPVCRGGRDAGWLKQEALVLTVLSADEFQDKGANLVRFWGGLPSQRVWGGLSLCPRKMEQERGKQVLWSLHCKSTAPLINLPLMAPYKPNPPSEVPCPNTILYDGASQIHRRHMHLGRTYIFRGLYQFYSF